MAVEHLSMSLSRLKWIGDRHLHSSLFSFSDLELHPSESIAAFRGSAVFSGIISPFPNFNILGSLSRDRLSDGNQSLGENWANQPRSKLLAMDEWILDAWVVPG